MWKNSTISSVLPVETREGCRWRVGLSAGTGRRRLLSEKCPRLTPRGSPRGLQGPVPGVCHHRHLTESANADLRFDVGKTAEKVQTPPSVQAV